MRKSVLEISRMGDRGLWLRLEANLVQLENAGLDGGKASEARARARESYLIARELRRRGLQLVMDLSSGQA